MCIFLQEAYFSCNQLWHGQLRTPLNQRCPRGMAPLRTMSRHASSVLPELLLQSGTTKMEWIPSLDRICTKFVDSLLNRPHTFPLCARVSTPLVPLVPWTILCISCGQLVFTMPSHVGISTYNEPSGTSTCRPAPSTLPIKANGQAHDQELEKKTATVCCKLSLRYKRPFKIVCQVTPEVVSPPPSMPSSSTTPRVPMQRNSWMHSWG